jgi:predicted Zn-dependent peptidase
MRVTKLSNGLTFISYPIQHAKSVEMGLYIKAGSRYETKNNNGITHLLEHIHFRQLGDMSQEVIYQETECMGTSLRGTTYKEIMNFHMKVRPKYLEKSLLFFEKILTTFNWTDEQLESEKKIVFNEIYEKEEEQELQLISDETIWQEHSLSQPILGNEQVIKRISLEELVNYKKEIFCKGNMVFVITGAIEDDDIKSITKQFERIPIADNKRAVIDENVVEAQFQRTSNIVMKKYSSWSFLDVQLSFDVNLTLIKENELLFLNSIIGGGDGSRLQKEIREKMGLVYDIYSYVEIYNDVAVLSIFFSIEKKNLQIGLQKIMDILNNLRVNISQRDMNMNITFFTDNLWFWLEDSHELNFQLGCDFIKAKELLTIEERIKENEKIDYYRLKEASNVIFRNENISLIVMGDTKGLTKKVLKDWLEV